MNILVCTGSRHGFGMTRTVRELDKVIDNYMINKIYVGDASGVDFEVAEYCRLKDFPIEVFKAHWKKYGSPAGPIRNREMVEQAVEDGDIVVGCVFPGGVGTKSCEKIMKKHKVNQIHYVCRKALGGTLEDFI